MKTTIDHTIRNKMTLSCSEYVVLDLIMRGPPFNVQINPDEFMNAFDKLIEKGYAERFNGIHDAKATEKALAYFKPDNSNFINNVIAFLNTHTNSKFSWQKKDSRKAIDARINEGYNYSDFCNVVKFKYNEWKNTNQEQYLRPVTLFGNNFEGYLQGALKSLPKPSENPRMEGMVM